MKPIHTMEAYQNHCRLCLGSEVVEYKLYGPETYSCVVKDYFGIELKQTVGWPLNACGECIRILGEMQELKKKIQRTHGKLVQLHVKAAVKIAMAKRLPKDLKEIEFVDPDQVDVQEKQIQIPEIKIIEPEAENIVNDCPEHDDATPMDCSTEVSLHDTINNPPRSKSPECEKEEECEEEESEDEDSEEDDPEDDSDWDPEENYQEGTSVKNRLAKRRMERVVNRNTSKDQNLSGTPEEMMAQLRLFKCHLCPRDHKTFKRLARHMSSKHQGQPPVFICCGVNLRRKELEDHMRFHLDKTTFACKVCSKVMISGYRLKIHEIGKHQRGDSEIQCDQCQRKFSSYFARDAHMNTVHSEEREVFSCEQCDKVYKSSDNLLIHVKRDHEGIRPFVCEICGMSWTTITQLRSHSKSHEKKMVQQCEICLKYFAKLSHHMANVHNKKDNVHCPICDKMVSARYFKLHTKTYHGEKKEMPCKICGKMFYTYKTLKVHMELHLGVVHPCRVCGREFGFAGNRTKHERAKHPEDYERLLAEIEAEKQLPPAGKETEDV